MSIVQHLSEVENELAWLVNPPRGDTPIEKLFSTALEIAVRYDAAHRFSSLQWWNGTSERPIDALFVEAQKEVCGWRADFVVVAWGGSGWKALIVECDGHNFHERTKAQAIKDRSRDRAAQAAGFDVFRFTGSELFHDAPACAEQVLEWTGR